MDKLVSLSRGRGILYRSFVVSLAALVVGAAIVGFTARAANYTALFAGAANWTATSSSGGSAVWGCGTVGPGDTCGIYPGSIVGNPFVDNANMNLGIATPLAVTTSIPMPVRINMNGFGMGVDVAAGGTLTLNGASVVTSTGGSNTLSVSGGTLSFQAGSSVGVNGLTPGAQFIFNNGSLAGSGSLTVSQQALMNVNGAGPMTSSNLLSIINNSTINYGPTSNGWTLNGPLANTGTFNDNGSSAITGAGSINNTGLFQKGSGAPSTVNVPFTDSGTVAITSTSGPSSIDFSAGGAISGPFNLGAQPGSSFLFAGTAASPINFNAGSSFSGNGDVTFHGARQNVNTTLSFTGNFTNSGNTFFGSAVPQMISVAGNFTQAAAPTGSIDARLFSATSLDKVAVTGTAGLSGNFNESVLYSPANGDTFQPATFSNNGGTTFQTVNAVNPNGVFLVSYPPSTPSATALQLVAAPSVDVSILKTGPASVLHNATASYTVKVGNAPGPNPATNVVINDSFNSGTFNPGASDPTCTLVSPGNITCGPIASIAPNTSVNIIVAINATSLTTITNTATLSSVTEIDTNAANNSSTATTTVTPVADLSLTKAGPPTVVAGAPISYTLTVNNAGPDPATNVTVTDALPLGLTGVTATGTGWTCSLAGSTVTCTATNLALGPAQPITINATAPTAGGSITNNAGVSETGSSDSNNANNNASVTTTVTASADIAITKTGPATIVAGQNITYNYSVTNNGPSNVVNVIVTDAPGAGLTPISSTAPCGGGFPCTIAILNSASTVNFTATFAVSPTATGSVSNTASASAAGVTDPNAANNNATAITAVTVNSDVAIAKTGPATAFPGQAITYTINVINNGPSTATGVVVSDPTPVGTTAGSVSGSCGSLPCTIGTLAPGAGASINATYVINPTTTAPVVNTATVTSTSADSNAANNTASFTTTVTPKADLTITKNGPATIPANGQITFTIHVTNLGPSTANSVVVNDTPGPGLTFLSNTGGCTTPFPCSFPTLASGGTITIQSTFKATATATTVTNYADVSSSTFDPNSTNNMASATVGAGNSCPTGPLSQFAPFSGQTNVPTSGTMQWTNLGATSYEVYLGPAGQGCSTLVATVNGTSYAYSGLAPNTIYESRVVAVEPSCPSVASQCIQWTTASGGCNLPAPQIVSPQPGATVGGSTTLQWNAVSGATSYHVVVVVNGTTEVDTTTSNTSLVITIPNGAATLSVSASSANCTGPASSITFNSCGAPSAPVAGVVGAPSSGNAYSVIVIQPSSTALSYEFQEATDPGFGSVNTQTTNATSVQYSHTTTVPQEFYYRVRATGGCGNGTSLFSRTIRVVIVPNNVNFRNPNINVPAGNRGLVTIQVQIPGDSVKENFTAVGDRPWIVSINPSSGILPPEGIVLNVSIDPALLPNGTFTATVIVTTSPIPSSSTRIVTNGNNAKSVPVSINLVTPVVPVNPDAPTTDSIFIPAVGHLAGLNSQWRSDIRIYNASPQTLQYMLNFTPQGSTDVKRTTITTASGDTTALDDIIHNWFGVGEVGDSSTGVLEIRPMTTDGSTTPPVGSAFTTVASSRTFDATGNGTVGQFIPPVKFTNFIGSGSRMSMQQLAQSTAYRTNFGLVEGSGAPVSLLLSMFNSAGTKLFDLPVNLAAGEQKLLNGLLAQQGVTSLSDGRMEVNVASGAGKVTAYASVIDNASLDPQLVPGQNLTNTSSKLYVVPGVADLNNGAAAWRTDMRIYNAGNTPSTMDVVFYPQDNASLPFFATVTVNPGEVKVLNSVLQSVFATSNVGGMVQLTTVTDSQLVVTARTYNQTSNGTLGQFIKAATSAEGITTSTKSLNILQVEDSPRFRTNLGIAEMSGKPATVEVSVILPDSKVTPSIQVPLGANEFRQFSVEQFGLGNIYNARVSVKVVGGAGSVTAYGSVIDQVTTDPTYIQAQ